jgi:7-carboxy-7-deazaguanine synthase
MTELKKVRIPLSESFYSIQGEGLYTGVPSVFVRLGGCNILCSSKTWTCDTVEVWRKSKAMSFEEIFKPYSLILKSHADVSIVVTGGEPLMHKTKIIDFISYILQEFGSRLIQIETNGTIVPDDFLLKNCFFNVSPKLESSGVRKEERYNRIALKVLSGENVNSIFKFVVSKETIKEDMAEIEKDFFSISPEIRKRTYLMPAGDTQSLLNEQREAIIEVCKQHGLMFTDRLHITVYDKKTGV